jgi:hypothetical protein
VGCPSPLHVYPCAWGPNWISERDKIEQTLVTGRVLPAELEFSSHLFVEHLREPPREDS